MVKIKSSFFFVILSTGLLSCSGSSPSPNTTVGVSNSDSSGFAGDALTRSLKEHLFDPVVARSISLENEALNGQCRNETDKTPSDLIHSFYSGKPFRNYSEPFPGFRRFEFPDSEALKEAKDLRICDEVITLSASGECTGDKKNVCDSAVAHDWHHWIPMGWPYTDAPLVMKALNVIYEARLNGNSICIHCWAGKHRTGMVSLLAEAANLETLDEASLDEIYERYRRHTWFSECQYVGEIKEAVKFLIETPEFLSFRKKWQDHIGHLETP